LCIGKINVFSLRLDVVFSNHALSTRNMHVAAFLAKTDRQTMLVYFTWPTKRPGGHQSQLTNRWLNHNNNTENAEEFSIVLEAVIRGPSTLTKKVENHCVRDL